MTEGTAETESTAPASFSYAETEPETGESTAASPEEGRIFPRPLFYSNIPRTEVNVTDSVRQYCDRFFLPLAEEGEPLAGGSADGAIPARVLPQERYQTVEGFGASGCWWACFSDQWEEEALDAALLLLYSPEGLGLTTYRHNVGGGTPKGFSGKGATRCVEEFPGFLNLENDYAGVRVMYKLQSLGVNYFTLFMNSPPARMTKNGDTRGAEDGLSNLKEECFEEYASFCCDVIELYEEAGIPVRYLSPVNEPQWKWSPRSYQEGCHYTPEECFQLDRLFVAELKRRGLSGKACIPETAAWYDAVYSRFLVSRLFFTDGIREEVDHISGHSYGSDAGAKQAMRQYLDSMNITWPIHQTEMCFDFSGGGYEKRLETARVIHEDLTILNATLWEWWVVLETPGSSPGGGALAAMDPETGMPVLNPQSYMIGQYSRFITGATRVGLEMEADGVYGSAWEKDGSIIVILTNERAEKTSVSLAGVSGKGDAWRTSREESLQYVGAADSAGGILLPPQSVTTLVFPPCERGGI